MGHGDYRLDGVQVGVDHVVGNRAYIIIGGIQFYKHRRGPVTSCAPTIVLVVCHTDDRHVNSHKFPAVMTSIPPLWEGDHRHGKLSPGPTNSMTFSS